MAAQIMHKDGHIFTTGSFNDSVAFDDKTLISELLTCCKIQVAIWKFKTRFVPG